MGAAVQKIDTGVIPVVSGFTYKPRESYRHD